MTPILAEFREGYHRKTGICEIARARTSTENEKDNIKICVYSSSHHNVSFLSV